MAAETIAGTPGPDVFASLTCNELTVLIAHLASCMAKQLYLTGGDPVHAETAATCHDLHIAWTLRWTAEHRVPEDGA